MINFSEIANNVATLAQRSGDSDYLDKVKVWVNLAHTFLFNSYDYWHETEDVHNFTSVADTENYVMPNRFDKPLRVYDLTNKKKLDPDTEEVYFDSNVANIADATTDVPSKYRIYGATGITGSIGSSGTIVKVKSSSSSDTSNPVIRVEGYIDSSRLVIDHEDITISASSPTSYVSGTKTFYDITHIGKSADTTGYITVVDSSNNTLAIIPSIERVLQHKIMKLGLIPDDAYSYRVLFKKSILRLVDDNDYPFVDADNFLIMDAYGWALSEEKERTQEALVVWQKAQEALLNILQNQIGKLGPDYQHQITNVFAQAHRV